MILACPWGGVLNMPIREETPGQTKRDYISRLAWEPFVGSAQGEKRLDLPSQTDDPVTWTWISGIKKMNEQTY